MVDWFVYLFAKCTATLCSYSCTSVTVRQFWYYVICFHVICLADLDVISEISVFFCLSVHPDTTANVRPNTTACCSAAISLHGEGNALYPVLCSFYCSALRQVSDLHCVLSSTLYQLFYHFWLTCKLYVFNNSWHWIAYIVLMCR